MSVRRSSEPLFDAVRARHRLLLFGGLGATSIGVGLAGYVAYDWFLMGVSHEVLALLAAVAVLFGVQLLVFTTLTSMLIMLHRETIDRFEAGEGE